jgi:hypothetical protein
MGCSCLLFSKLTPNFCIVIWGEQFFFDDHYITLWMLVMFICYCIGMIFLIKILVFFSVTYFYPFSHNLAIKTHIDSMPIKLVYYQLDIRINLDPNPILTRIDPNLTTN